MAKNNNRKLVQAGKAGQSACDAELWSLLSELDKVSSLKEQQRGTKGFSLLISGFGQRRRGVACQVSPTEPTESLLGAGIK